LRPAILAAGHCDGRGAARHGTLPLMSDYNGFTSQQRTKALRWLNREYAAGAAPAADEL
jgi:hypothetical protein